jgi:hypothetical protein
LIQRETIFTEISPSAAAAAADDDDSVSVCVGGSRKKRDLIYLVAVEN